MAVYGIAEKAYADMAKAAMRARHALEHGINRGGLWYRITREQASEMYWAEVREIMREARIEVNPDTPIAAQCRNCKRVAMVKRDVKVFKCHCSPYEEQWVLKSRHIEI